MITIIFLAFLGMFAVAGIFVSIEAKKGGRGSQAHAGRASSNKPVERATQDND
jgi:hypothetical protein